jgi:hypothetical protein
MFLKMIHAVSILAALFPLALFAQVEVLPGGTVELNPRAAFPYVGKSSDKTECNGEGETCAVHFYRWDDTFFDDTIFVYANQVIGIDSQNAVYGAIGMGFYVPEGEQGASEVLSANISGDALINYVITSAPGIGGLLGRAEVSINLVRASSENSNMIFNDFFPFVIKRVDLLNDECKTDFGVDGCYSSNEGSYPFNFDVKLTRGQYYYLVLSAKCTTSTGIFGGGAICDMGQVSPPVFGVDSDANRVTWDGATITVEPDLFEVLFELQDQLEELTTKVENIQVSLDSHETSVQQRFDALDADLQKKFDVLNSALDQHDADIKAGQDQLKAGQEEVIKLLKTPEGKRPGFNKDGY